jgi:hypothetical protein
VARTPPDGSLRKKRFFSGFFPMTMTLEEMIEILEGIAREGTNAAARVAAIKTLMEIAPPEPDTDIWKELDELAPRRTKAR